MMARYHVMPATRAHAEALASTMHHRSRAEARDLNHKPLASLLKGLDTSAEAWTGFADDRPVCMFGIVPDSDISNEGHIWLAINRDLKQHARSFLTANRRYLADALTRYRRLYGFVFARNTVSIRWLMWLGFVVSEECIQDTDTGHVFRRFDLERS